MASQEQNDIPLQRCPVCGRIFLTAGDLAMHVEEVHPESANSISGTASPETLGAGL